MSLSAYIPSFLGNIYDFLSWDSTKVDFIIEEVLEKLDITAETDVEATVLHAVAKYVSLENALNDLSISFKFSADGGSYDRQQVFDMVEKRFNDAEVEASKYLPSRVMTVSTIDFQNDPYNVDSYENFWV